MLAKVAAVEGSAEVISETHLSLAEQAAVANIAENADSHLLLAEQAAVANPAASGNSHIIE